MKYAIVLDGTTLGAVVYLMATKQIVPLTSSTVAMCCGEPTDSGTTVDVQGKMIHGKKCCGCHYYHPLKAGDRVTGDLVEGTFVVAEYIGDYMPGDLPSDGLIEGSDELF